MTPTPFIRSTAFPRLLVLLIAALSAASPASRLASPVTNRPDPFGPLPAATTNIFWINRAGNLDYVDIIYKNTSIQRRLVNQNTAAGAGLLRLLDVWNGQDDLAANCPTGTYDSRIKVNRIAAFDRRIPAAGSFPEFNEPRDLACDRFGCVYVLDPSLNTVQKFSSDGSLVWKWTIPAGAGLSFPDTVTGGIAVDTNLRVFVSGQGAAGRARVSMMDQAGTFVSNRDSSANQDDNFGGLGYSPEYNRLFSASQANLNPYGFSSGGLALWFRNTAAPVAMLDFTVINTPVNDWIYGVNDNDFYRWRMATGAPPNCFVDNEVPLQGLNAGIADTRSITQRSNKYLYTVSRGTHQVRQFSTNLTVLETRSGLGYGDTNLWAPSGIAWDALNDLIWVADTSNQRLVCYAENAAGNLQFVRKIETSPYIMRTPLDIAIDRSGNSFVIDNGACKVKKFDEFGNVLLTFGGQGSGLGRFRDPQGIAVDEDGFIYVSDYGTANGADAKDCVQVFSPAGVYRTNWDLVDPRGMAGFQRNGTNFIAVTYQPVGGIAREYGIRVYRQNGTVLQDFWANDNQKNYLDVDLDYAGNFYAIDNFRADQVDHYPATASGPFAEDNIAIGGGRSGLGVDPYGTLWVPNTTSDAIEARQGWAVGGGVAAPLFYQFGSLGTADGQFTDPNYCAIRMREQAGRWADLLVVDSGNSRLQKFIISWSNETSDPVTVANPGAPAVTAAYPDPTSSTNVVYDGGTGVFYSRAGKAVFKVFFSQNMNTNLKPSVQFVTFDNSSYPVAAASYIGNVWIGTARVPPGHDGPADIRVDNAYNLSASNIRPNPTILADAFVIDTTPPSLSFVNPVAGTVSVATNLLVDGNSEAVIRIDIFNWSASSGGTLTASISNVFTDGSGYFMVNTLRLRTPKDSTNFVTARARDKAGNWSADIAPRRLVRCIDAIGYAYLEPATNRRLGETGNPGIVFTWQANAIMNNVTVTIDVPSGWSIPSTNRQSPGFVRCVDSSGLSFTTGRTLWSDNPSYPGRLKVNISSVADGGYFKIRYGTNSLTMISNSPSTMIGLNEWIAKSTNTTVLYTNLWEPPRKVGEVPGKSMKIPVIGKPVLAVPSNRMTPLSYRGAASVPALSLSFVNSNFYHADTVNSLVLTVQNSFFQDVNANTRLTSVSVYTGGVLLSTLPAPASPSITIDLASFPLAVPVRGTNRLEIRMNISPTTSFTDVRFKIGSGADISAKNLQNLAGTPIGVSGSFPWTSGYCRIRTNNVATRIFSRVTNLLPPWVEAGQSGLSAFRLVLTSTNANVNDTEVTRIRIDCEDRNANGIVPDSFIGRLVLQRVNNGPVYIQKSPVETSGNTILLTPSGLLLPSRTSVTCEIKIDVRTNATATNVRFSISAATNVAARDTIVFSTVSNFASAGEPYPQRTSDSWLVRSFRIEHDTLGSVNVWEKVVFRIWNANRAAVTNFNGTVTLGMVNGNPNAVGWTNLNPVPGVLTDLGAGSDKARYRFVNADRGVVSLYIRDTVSETLTVSAADAVLVTRSNNLRIAPDTTPPSVPILVFPANSLLTNAAALSLRWQMAVDSGSGMTNYLVYTNGVPAGTVSWSVTNFTVASTIREGTHTWRIKSVDKAGNTNVSAQRIFTIDRTGPTAPLLVYPRDSQLTNNTSVNLRWVKPTDANGLTNYLVVLDGSLTTNIVTAPTTNHPAAGLSQGLHAWMVRARDRAGNLGSWSGVSNFTVDTVAPPVVLLQSPVSNGTIPLLSALLQWSASVDATAGVSNYIVQFSTNASFANPFQKVTNSLGWTVAGLRNGSTNHWRVRAYDRAANTNAWSAVWRVKVDTNQLVAVLQLPANGAITNSVNPTFLWGSPAGAGRYRIELRTNDIGGPVIASNTNVAGNTANLGVSLKNGVYDWRVGVFKTSTGQWQNWSGDFTFTVDTLFTLQLLKNIYITNSPSFAALGGDIHAFVPGALCVYTIVYTNLNRGRGTNVILRDVIGSNLRYVPGSTILDGIPQSDAVDSDKTDFNVSMPNTVTCTLKSVSGRARGTFVYSVYVK